MEGFMQRKDDGEDGWLHGVPGSQQGAGCLLEGTAEPAADEEKEPAGPPRVVEEPGPVARTFTQESTRAQVTIFVPL